MRYYAMLSWSLLHRLDKVKHFVGAFASVTVIIVGYRVCRCKMFAPEFIDLEAAFVDVEMNVALFKIRGTGFPHHRFGVQSLNGQPCAVSDAFSVFLGGHK